MAKTIEYKVLDKGTLGGKRAIEGMLPDLGADGYQFAFETPQSYVFWRELPKAEEAPKRPNKKPASS